MNATFTFTKAVKQQEKLRLALDGPSGSGKTWTSLLIATYLIGEDGGRIAVIDSERGSARKYASDFDFDHLVLPDSSPFTYIGAVNAAIEQRYGAIIVDSLSHAWEGTLEYKDEVTKRSRSKNSFDAWREVTPVHNELVDTLLRAPAHLIVTMRTKTAYVIEEYEDDNGRTKSKPTKIGMKPIQRDGVEYEFDVVGDLDQENTLVITKTRCSSLAGAVIRHPGEQMAKTLWGWLNDGEPIVPADPAVVEELRARLNALTGDDRYDFKTKFGVPADLQSHQVSDATAFVLGREGKTDPPPDDGGGKSSAPDEPSARDDSDVDAGAAEPDDRVRLEPAAAGAPDGTAAQDASAPDDDPDRVVSDVDMLKLAGKVFGPARDLVARGVKTKAIDSCRHALTHLVTDGRTAHHKNLDLGEKQALWNTLRQLDSGYLQWELEVNAGQQPVALVVVHGVDVKAVAFADLDEAEAA